MASTEVAPVKQSADNALIAMIVTAAQTNSIEIEKLTKLMEMRERILAQEAEIAFNAAMNAAQSEMLPILKDGENPYAKSRYATLEKVDREIRPIYTKHGFCLTFNTGTPAALNAVHVICEVRHSQGYKKEYFLEGDLDVSGAQGKSNKTSIQGLGSSVSYLRRYLTLMIFNLTLTNEDNDGNGNRDENRIKYDAMRHAADARQAAREAAQSVQKEPVYEHIPEDEPGLPPPYDEQLRDSLVQFPPKKRKPKLNGRQIAVVEIFKPLHDAYTALGMESRYYQVLAMPPWQKKKSTEFKDQEEAQPCISYMQLDVQERKVWAKQQEENNA